MSFFACEVSHSFSRLLRICQHKSNLFEKFPKHSALNYSKHIPWNGILFQCYCSKKSEEDPLNRVVRIIKDDVKRFINVIDGLPEQDPQQIHCPKQCDILIIGGGIIGSSIAYWLKQRTLSGLHIVVLEKDCSVIDSNFNNSVYNKYGTASTTLSAGGLRHQFSLPENIQMSVFGSEFLRNINDYLGIEGFERPDVQFTPQGYLFLATEKSAKILEENSKLQRSFGAKNELLTPSKIKEKWPWMNVDNIELGCHGLENEGWFDPWSLLMAFKKKALFLGTEYVTGELESFNFYNQPEIIMESIPAGEYESIREANIKFNNGERRTIQFSQLIIAAGCNSGAVGHLCKMGNGPGYLQLPIPVEPRKRYVYCIHSPNGPGLKAPFVIDPSGMYFRREGLGDMYICGMSPDPSEEPECDNMDVDYNFFNEKIWPLLAQRVPAFEALKIKSAWAGFYDFNTFDENAFIGPHPSYINVFLATGFSGHGLQQAPAVGRAMMELIIDGRYKSIDLTRMQFERIFYDEYLQETNIV